MPPAEDTTTRRFMQKLIAYVGRNEIRQQVQQELIDPLLTHVMRKVFPYIILICVLFVLLLLVVLLTLGIIVFQLRGSIGVAAVGAGA